MDKWTWKKEVFAIFKSSYFIADNISDISQIKIEDDGSIVMGNVRIPNVWISYNEYKRSVWQ